MMGAFLFAEFEGEHAANDALVDVRLLDSLTVEVAVLAAQMDKLYGAIELIKTNAQLARCIGALFDLDKCVAVCDAALALRDAHEDAEVAPSLSLELVPVAVPVVRTRLWGGEGWFTVTGGYVETLIPTSDGSDLVGAFKPDMAYDYQGNLDAPDRMPTGSVRFSHIDRDGTGVSFASDLAR